MVGRRNNKLRPVSFRSPSFACIAQSGNILLIISRMNWVAVGARGSPSLLPPSPLKLSIDSVQNPSRCDLSIQKLKIPLKSTPAYRFQFNPVKIQPQERSNSSPRTMAPRPVQQPDHLQLPSASMHGGFHFRWWSPSFAASQLGGSCPGRLPTNTRPDCSRSFSVAATRSGHNLLCTLP
jgi:hypothetical protein